MQKEQTTEQEFGTFTRTQAGLGLFSFVFTLFFAGAVFSQEVVPQLQMDEYNANLMNQVYGQSYFLNSLNAWTDQVTYYKGLLRASWESAADNAIYNYVSGITTSDTYNTVDAYKDYVQRELDSQKMVALNSWEDKANLDFLANKNQFVARLTTNEFDQAYIERVGVQQQYQQILTENQRVNQLQNNIANAANNWNANFNQSYQSGLNDFANTLGNIQDQYNSFLTNLDESEATFQNNLTAIDSYKTVVKNAVRGVVGQFQGMLDEGCSMDGCLYKYANGQFNAAGNTLNSLVGRLNTVLNSSTLDASNVLTTISAEIRTFLSSQANSAYLTTVDYSQRVNTIQLGLHPSLYGVADNSPYFTGIATGALGYSTAMQTSAWNGGLGAGTNLFENVANGEVRAVANAIVFGGGDPALKGYLESILGNGRTVSIIASNIYTDWAGGVHKNDPWSWVSLSGTQRDYRSDGNPWVWTAVRTGFTTDFQMGAIGFDLVYWMNDPVAQAHATYWQGNYNSLGGQLNTYTNQISPAVNNWESQVASYNSFYEQWKVSADELKAQAKLDYDNALADLETKKSAWVQKMEDERQASIIKWNELSNQAASAESTADLQNVNKTLLNTYNTSISNINIATNTDDLMNSYNGSLTDLGNRDFTFVEPAPIQNPILDNQIVPKLELASLSVGALGNKIVSDGMVFGVSNALGISTLKQDPFVYSAMNTASTALGGIGGFLSGSSTSTGQKFSIMNAASEKKVDTELTIEGKSLDEVFGKTTNGVYQYAQLLSMNENNSITATKEQEKLINQMAYQVNWDTRTAASLNKDGKLELTTGIGGFNNGELEALLTRISKYDYKGEKFEGVCVTGSYDYTECTKREAKLTAEQTKDYNKNFGTEIAKLASAGFEIQGGKIVRSLSQEEKIRLGQLSDTSSLTAEEKKIYGTCYVNPASCNLLKKEFDTEFNKETGVVKLSKIISNGQIGGKDDKGYISGTQNEVRYVSLSQVKPVTAPVGKDLFDEWDQADWTAVDAQASAIMNDFYTKDLARDGKIMSESTALIRDTESKNEKRFQEAKTAQEAADSFLKDMIIAYMSGGMAGIKASIKGKIEDKINSDIAAAFIRATGGSEDQIAMATQLVSYMRGKVQERKIKSNMAQNNLTNAAMAGLAVMTGGASLLLSGVMNSAMGAMAGMGNMLGSAGAMLGATFGGSMASLGLGATSTVYRAVAGDKAADAMMNRITGPKDQLAAIKANENAMIKSSATTAIASATGLPKDVVGQMLTDYQGSQAAKKVRNSVNSNPIGNIGSQVAGVVGGIVKTAAVAFGAKERDIQKMLSDGNRMLYSGVTDSNLEAQSLAYLNQSFGMKAPGTSYTSNIPKDNAGIVEEIGQRIVVEEIVKATGMDKDVADAAFRKQYGAIKQKKADKKAQNKAIRSTAITAVVTVATLGAAAAASAAAAAAQTATAAATAAGASAAGAAAAGSAAAVAATTAVASTGFLGAVGSALATVGTFVGASATAAANVGAAIFSGAVQAIDGSRNGTQGIIAGLANGAIGAFTAGGGMNLTGKAAEYLGQGALGLGVSYDKQNGWGGAIGIGGAKANASITFSQRGDTTISGSMTTGIKGIQLTASSTTNGATTIGVNYNPSDKGPRQGWNVGANYDVNGGGFSGSVGYTNSKTGLGLTSTIDRNGLSTSGQLNGVSLATMTQNGFQYDEISWTDININKAQDMTDEIRQKAADIATIRENMPDVDVNNLPDTEIARIAGEINTQNENKQLLKDGKTQAEIDAMTPWDREQALDRINNVVDPSTIALAALTTVGSAALAFVGLGGNNGRPLPIPAPVAPPARVVEVPRRKDGEDAAGGFGNDNTVDHQQHVNLDNQNSSDYADNKGDAPGVNQPDIKPNNAKVEKALLEKSTILKKIETDWAGDTNLKDHIANLEAETYFSAKAGEDYLKKLKNDKLISADQLKEVTKYYNKALNPIAKNADATVLNKLQENLPITRKQFDPLVPHVSTVIIPTVDTTSPKAGGRTIEFANGVKITEHNLIKDNKILEKRVNDNNDHNYAKNKAGEDNHKKKQTVIGDEGVGTNQEVRYNIPSSMEDSSKTLLWESYTHGKLDNIHQFTDRPTAEMFITGAQKWKEYLAANGGTHQPIRTNDFSMPGAGKSPYLGGNNKTGHHQNPSSIDIGIPGRDGTQVQSISENDLKSKTPEQRKAILANYDQGKTRDLIKIMGESVPPGYRLQVFFNDKDLIKEFAGSNIEVSALGGHNNHLHFSLVKIGRNKPGEN